MIHVSKDFNKYPIALDFNAVNAPIVAIIEAAIEEGTSHVANRGYYRDKIKEQLFELYNFKCAYCEAELRKCDSALHIDHYRPRRGKMPDKSGQDIAGIHHHGYPWLTYEWSNLLPVCASCNAGKSSSFPIEGNRVAQCNDKDKANWGEFQANSRTYQDEKPLLLHPEIDDPNLHFRYNISGKIYPQGERGKETIKTYKLDRPGLDAARKTIADLLVARIKKMAAPPPEAMPCEGALLHLLAGAVDGFLNKMSESVQNPRAQTS